VLSVANNTPSEEIEQRLKELQKELVDLASSNTDYSAVADEILKLRGIRQTAMSQNAKRDDQRRRVHEMMEFLNDQTHDLEEYDEQLIRRLIERITVFGNRLGVEAPPRGYQLQVVSFFSTQRMWRRLSFCPTKMQMLLLV
jgi:nucleotidyltransferase/DNA polymerase involved in DNA repair